MVPLALIKAKKEAAKAEAENRPSASERREKKREAMSDARRYANGVSVTAMLVAILLGAAVAAWIDRPGPIRWQRCSQESSSASFFSSRSRSPTSGSGPSCCGSGSSSGSRAGPLRHRAHHGHGLEPDRPARACDRRDGRVGPDPRHGAGQRRRHRLLDGLGRGEVRSRGGGLRGCGHALGADGAARGDRAARAGRDDHRARAAGQGAAADPGREDESRGGSRCSRWRFATCSIPPDLEDAMSRGRRRPNGSGRRASFWARPRPRSPSGSSRRRDFYESKPVALHLRAMNMLYEAIKEKGSMVIVPSSAVETMGLGGLAGLTALGRPAGPDAPSGSKPGGTAS